MDSFASRHPVGYAHASVSSCVITMPIRSLLLAATLLSALTVSAESPNSDTCSRERLAAQGGAFTTARDGVRIWYKLAGRADAPVIAYLHGGPGYNAFTFEKSAGPFLEQHFRVLYFDQRGCGRSTFDGPEERYGMQATIADLEQLRTVAQTDRLILAGHSFGGAVAAEYAARYPAHVAAIVMIDTAHDLPRALDYQVEHIDAIAGTAFPAKAAEIHEIAGSSDPAMDKLAKMYGAIGRLPLQRQLHFAERENQERMEALDHESGLLSCTSAKAVQALAAEGYLAKPLPNLTRRLEAPTLLIAGRASHVIGETNIRRAAEVWGARLEWLDAGHFAYFEQPQAFAEMIDRFVKESVGKK